MKKSPEFLSIKEFDFIKPANSSKDSLGVGSFATVKLAKHIETQEQYAIKIIDKKTLTSLSEREGINTEIRIHSKLDHPNVIKFFGSFEEGDFIYIILEYAEKGNLFNYLRRKKRLSESEAFGFFYQTSMALSYVHKKNVVHRDIKPENLLLDKNNHIKLADFGWCAEGIYQRRMTFCGTYEYMAPEIVFRQAYDYMIDIWGVGILLYELMHGKSPFQAKSLQEIQQKLKGDGEITFSDQISWESKELIKKILKKSAGERINLKAIFEDSWTKRMFGEVSFEMRFKEIYEKHKIRMKELPDTNENRGGEAHSFSHSKEMYHSKSSNNISGNVQVEMSSGSHNAGKKKIFSNDPGVSIKSPSTIFLNPEIVAEENNVKSNISKQKPPIKPVDSNNMEKEKTTHAAHGKPLSQGSNSRPSPLFTRISSNKENKCDAVTDNRALCPMVPDQESKAAKKSTNNSRIFSKLDLDKRQHVLEDMSHLVSDFNKINSEVGDKKGLECPTDSLASTNCGKREFSMRKEKSPLMAIKHNSSGDFSRRGSQNMNAIHNKSYDPFSQEEVPFGALCTVTSKATKIL